MKYRKKPVTVEAFRYDGDLMYSNGQWYCPDWARDAFQSGVIYYDSPGCGEPPTELYIDTLEGKHHVSVGDYIIQGVAGELYPCKPGIFEKTYEKSVNNDSGDDIKHIEDTISIAEKLANENSIAASLCNDILTDEERLKYIGRMRKMEQIALWPKELKEYKATCCTPNMFKALKRDYDTEHRKAVEYEKMVNEYLEIGTPERCKEVMDRTRWIPVSERMPEDEKEVLVWFEYFQYGYYNRLYQTYGIGYAENGEWSPIVNGTTGWTDLNIIAWMPLPEPYKENWSRKRTGD